MTSLPISQDAANLPATSRDLFALTKPRVMSLVVFTGLCGLLAAPVSLPPVLGFTAIKRRDIAAHRAWMITAYAIGLGAGTQVFTQGFGGAIFGTGVLAGDLAKGAGWAINLAVAVWVIRRPVVRRRRRALRAAASRHTNLAT